MLNCCWTHISWAVHHPGMKPNLEELHLLFYCCKWSERIANVKLLGSFRPASLGPTCFFSLNLIRAVQVGASIIYIWLWPAGSCVLEEKERLLLSPCFPLGSGIFLGFFVRDGVMLLYLCHCLENKFYMCILVVKVSWQTVGEHVHIYIFTMILLWRLPGTMAEWNPCLNAAEDSLWSSLHNDEWVCWWLACTQKNTNKQE